MKSLRLASILQFIMFITVPVSFSQTAKVPPFRMVRVDGTIFRAEDLPMEKPILIIYFSPECEECQALTQEILSHTNELRKSSVAMITYLPVEMVKQYITKNKLTDFENIYIGTEGNYLFVKEYYKIERFPFMALYSKNGDLIKKYYSTEIEFDDMLSRLKGL